MKNKYFNFIIGTDYKFVGNEYSKRKRKGTQRNRQIETISRSLIEKEK